MENSSDNVYMVVKDERGQDLLCPLREVSRRYSGIVDERHDCFEKDVAERYSGNIIIVA